MTTWTLRRYKPANTNTGFVATAQVTGLTYNDATGPLPVANLGRLVAFFQSNDSEGARWDAFDGAATVVRADPTTADAF